MYNNFIQIYAEHHDMSYEEGEAEVVSALYETSRSVSPKFKFGFMDLDDMLQEGVLLGLEGLMSGEYDISRPIRPFLRSHIHNRLHNFKRNNYYRMEIPCRCCEVDTPTPCQKYERWLTRNNAKKSLAAPSILDFEVSSPSPKSGFLPDLRDRLPDDLHKSLDRVLRGKFVGKKKMERLNEYVNSTEVD